MSKRVSLEKGTFFPEKCAEHIKKYMNDHDLNRNGMALECGLERKTIYALCDAKNKAYSLDTFNQITKNLGSIRDYWLGLTDEITDKGRTAELSTIAAKNEYAKAADEAWEQLHRLRAEELEHRRNFFYMCGYRYESIEGTALDDFCSITEDTQGMVSRPHILTNYADNTRHELTQEQFKDLFDKLQDTINFACFQADKANQ